MLYICPLEHDMSMSMSSKLVDGGVHAYYTYIWRMMC